MKRMFSILLAAALLLSLLPACNEQGAASPVLPVESEPAGSSPSAQPEETELGCNYIVMAIWGELGILIKDSDILIPSPEETEEQERLAFYIEGAYGLKPEEWEDAAIARATGASAVELSVLRFADEDAAQHGEECLRDYLHSREGDFTGYAPDQAKLVADGALCRQGQYVGLFICKDSDLAESTFEDIIKTGELPELPEPTPTPGPTDDVDELLDRFLEACALYGDDTSSLERVDSSDPDRLSAIVDGEYGLADYGWEDAAIARGMGGNVFEIAVIQAGAGADIHTMSDIVEVLNAYLDAKEEAYARFPAQAELLHEAKAGWNEKAPYVLLLVCNEPTSIGVSLGGYLGYSGRDAGFSSMRRHTEEEPVASTEPAPAASDYPDRIKFTPPNKDDMSLYDTSVIRAAWAAGDPSGLSDYDRETYDAAQAILGEILTDGMSDLEKETAIYYWLVNNVDYDWRHQDFLASTPRSSFEPHGGLVDYTAVCLGYATSFQLLMDLAGVECITVVGAAFNSEEDHGWNMVRLNGNWYCVDVTWDANMREQAGPGEPEDWRYFNITSDEMAAKSHQWDYANIPEATATDRGQG